MVQLPIPLGKDLLVSSCRLVPGSAIAYGALEAHIVVMLHVARHDAARIIHGQGSARPNALTLERLMPSLDLAVALRVMWRNPDVCLPLILMNSLKSLAIN
jgi:hypothetical protein